MDGCRLCLDPYAAGPFYPLANPYTQEQLDTVFNFTIDTTAVPTPSGICQHCSTVVSDFYQFSLKVRQNQEQLNGTLPTTNIKVEATEFVVTPVGETDLQREFKEELTETDDKCYESPAEKDVEPDAEGPSAKRKRRSCGQSSKSKEVDLEGKLKEEQSEEELSEEEQSEEDDDDFSDDDESYEPSPKKGVELGDEDDRKSSLKKRQRGRPRKPKNNDQEGRIKPKVVRNFSSKEQIQAEFKKISEFYEMKCNDCGVVTEDFHSLNAHHKEAHNRKGFIVCCGRQQSKRKSMLQHMLLHENPEAFRCHICNKKYAGRNSLMHHVKNSHSLEEQKVFKCELCPQSFAVKHLLTAHLWTHQQEGCKDCGKTFSSKSALRMHEIKMHSGIDRRKICDICGQEFLDKSAFERHVAEHAGIEVVKKLQCHICQRWLSGERRLKIHLENTHYDQQTYTCDICNRECPSKLALHSHKKTVHVAEKYSCEFCGAKFKQNQSLKEHRTIHTGEVLYSCQYCGKSTNSHANFYSHIKKDHPAEWALRKQNKAPMTATAGSGT